jgi:sulfite exporter TauE/SafE
MMKKTKASRQTSDHSSGFVRWAEIGVMLIIVVAVYQTGKYLEIFSFASATEEVVGLGTVFLIGVTASTSSCLAMVGGLLLSVSSSWSKAHPRATQWQKLEPQLHFNIGRVIGYFIFGGLTGILGQALILTIHETGVLKVTLSVVMIILGLNILGIIPKRYCKIPLPKAMVKKIKGLSGSESMFAPLGLGALTYFIPCGFTQSMQLLALGSGHFWSGAAIMTVFALGTLPALLGISTLSSMSQGRFGRLFLTFSGCVSLFLGIISLHGGLQLSGINVRLPIFTASAVFSDDDPNVSIDRNGQQIISVGVKTQGYSSNAFTIEAGKPTWIYAVAAEPLTGCISSMTIPDFNVSKLIRKGENWVGPITPSRDFAFMCSMGMFKADVRVRS